MVRPIKVVVAKAGLDGHNIGAKVIANALQRAGMEVVYTGMYMRPRDIVKTCLEEDAEVLALSFMDGGHIEICRLVREEMERQGFSIPIVAGGIIPKVDRKLLSELGVSGLFGPGTPLDVIVEHVRSMGQQGEPERVG